jgi:hypothetical protein
MKQLKIAGVCGALLVSLMACGRDRETLSPASRPAVADNERSILALAASRCDREERCGNVGPNGSYTSRQDCLTRIERDTRDDLNVQECPGGIDYNRLDQCLTEIRQEECGHVLDKLERVAECRSGALCLD